PVAPHEGQARHLALPRPQRDPGAHRVRRGRRRAARPGRDPGGRANRPHRDRRRPRRAHGPLAGLAEGPAGQRGAGHEGHGEARPPPRLRPCRQHPEGRARLAMGGASLPGRVAPVLRFLVLALLAAAPLAFGSVHEAAFVPLLALSSLAGLLSWAKGHWARAQGALVPKLPGRRALLALHLLVLA